MTLKRIDNNPKSRLKSGLGQATSFLFLHFFCFQTFLYATQHDEFFLNDESFLVASSTSDKPKATAMPSKENTKEVSAEEEEESAEEDFGDELEEEFSQETESEVFDPFSGYNRFMTEVNDTLSVWILIPTAKGYRWVVPESPRRAIARFFNNLYFPVRFVNNVLQLKFKNAGEEFLRFGINTTVGLLGFTDPAKDWFDLEAHPEDFGQTLGHYGVGGGFHIVLPVLGPSNLRDAVSLAPDIYLDPISHIEDRPTALAGRAFKIINTLSLRVEEYESLRKDAIDLYPFLRDIYEQNRKRQIEE